MQISRRGFLGCAAGVSAIGIAGRPAARVLPIDHDELSGCSLVDPGPSCPLPESFAGYESALRSLGFNFERCLFQSFGASRMIILPAALMTNESSVSKVRAHLVRGATVLFESGAAYASAREFDSQRRLIESSFGLRLHDSVRLWGPAGSFRQSPYIDYYWPMAVKVRDFSRVIPIGSGSGEEIARFQNLPVAARRRIGRGTFVFLGSPVGPHLLAGDREARDWLGAVCSFC